MVTVSYGIGLLNAWAILWSATLVIFNDARGDFRRIEEQDARAETGADKDDEALGKAAVNGDADSVPPAGGQDLRKRKTSNKSMPDLTNSSSSSTFRWQTLPNSASHRLDWVTDLVTNFRGVRWSHQISGLNPPPSHIQKSLDSHPFNSPTEESNLTRLDLLKRDLPSFLLCVLILDILKSTTMHDPYFWGIPSTQAQSPFPFPKFTRLVLSLAFTYTSLLQIFLLAPLIFSVLFGPNALGQHAWPWLYAPYNRSSREVCKKGLAGFWGGWWHQLFRLAFEQAGEFAGRMFGWGKRSQKGMVLRVCVAFGCSGALHACASYGTLGDTSPIKGSFAFFMVQPVGLIGQRAAAAWIKKAGLRDRITPVVREIGNSLFVLGWFYLTGPLIADDFAACGIWLYEPVGISLIKGLRGEGWWKWGGRWVRWYSADKWWMSGFTA